MSLQQQTFLSSANADFVAELYARYRAEPNSVDSSWASFFNDLRDDEKVLLGELRGASWAPRASNKIVGSTYSDEPAPKTTGKNAKTESKPEAVIAAPAQPSPAPTPNELRAATQDSLRALMLIRSYRVRGHLAAKLDPLGLMERASDSELDPAHYGFTAADFDRPIFIDGVLGHETATLRQIIAQLQKTYCGTVGIEFMHIQSPEEKHWLQTRIEAGAAQAAFDKPRKLKVLQRLMAGEGFEKFLQVKFTGVKRFGLEGGETMIPALEAMIERGAELGLREVVVGMAHRGRLNVLTNILGKSFTAMFAEFQGTSAYPDSVQGSGDVKYHLGTSTDREFAGHSVHLTMNANPSHLEWVNPLVVGRVRAKQQQYSGSTRTSDDARDQVVALQLHGDAAFAGQGIVPETLMLSELLGYRTGGSLHFVINNQVGFTTSPQYSRSGVYCTDVAKMIQAPIFHVNGDDVEAVVRCAILAIEYRQQFHRDVVIDMVCYRRHGHNESDEPAFTQPLMYAAIKQHPTIFDVYSKQLIAEGSFTPAETEAVQKEFMARMEKDFQAATTYKPNKADWLEGKWQGLEAAPYGEDSQANTGVDMALLREVGQAISRVPSSFAINPKIAKQLEAKRQMIESGEGIDWATAEALAFGSLVVEGTPVRLSGQDVGRGTFSQRHATLYDQNNEERFRPLNSIRADQARFEAHDSPLSEAAVLGFDYGFSLAEPHALVCWEGQFGDFVNGAQIIIDQFIASSESKWLRMSGITLLLPHGYEGQGPEHSSCRIERFLQLCAEDNWQVANCTTPANYFHILRRQMRRKIRKPLILATPKSLLRHKSCVSKLAEFGPNTTFQRVIGETAALQTGPRVKRAVICSGKVYYDLLAARDAQKLDDVALIRLEQFYPFPHKLLAQELARYPNAEVIWCQEEPENQGGWTFVDRRIEAVLTELGGKTKRPIYVGRAAGSAPATGSLKRHTKEQDAIVNKALGSMAAPALVANAH
jgi:2-oxoglutarate dehydrogenase E1 component